MRAKCDFNKVLTLFSPISKDRATLYPNITEEIDVLIATDCISEGQNLQDCDYLINYDIHWNPVRVSFSDSDVLTVSARTMSASSLSITGRI